jgi:hypothetical protein
MVFPWAELSPAETADSFVVLEADDPRAALARRVGTGLTIEGSSPLTRVRVGTLWDDVCVTPCQKHVDTTAVYRIEGEGIWPSSSFRLAEGTTVLRARTGSRTGLLGGAMLTLAGGGLTLVGGMVAAFSALPIDSNGDAESQRDTRRAVLVTGLVLLGVGVVSLVSGIALWVTNTTSVTDARGTVLGGGSRLHHAAWSLTPQGLTF